MIGFIAYVKKKTFGNSEEVDDLKWFKIEYDEILEIIEKYGMPQDWNDDGKYGPERYIEAHIWSDEVIDKYKEKR